MIDIQLATLANSMNGQLICPDSLLNVQVKNIVTDSRELVVNQAPNETYAFLALKGANFDGHRFVQQVVDKGCQLLIVDHHVTDIDSQKVIQIVVEDTRIALGKVGAYVKEKVSPKTVGITGSSGKTTVKEMLAAILSRLGNVLATNGNFNNDIGVPLTLLRLEQAHDFAVIEMGANHIGEIAYTAELVKPDIAMINNIAAAHLEGFGDLCGVARAKGEIFSGLPTDGIALYNQDTKYTNKWQWRLTDKKVRTFSCENSRGKASPISADCYSENVELDESGCAKFDLKSVLGQCEIVLTIPGKHNVCNAVAAVTAAIECGATLTDIQLGLAGMAPVKGRLNIHNLPKTATCNEIRLIDDTYNANVESIKAAITLLAGYSGLKILVLGDMAELGSEARSYHQEVGEYAKEQGIQVLLTLGVLSQNTSDAFSKDNNAISEHFNDRGMLKESLINSLNNQSDDTQKIQILVKGSRSAHMEYVVEDIINWHAQQQAVSQPLSTNKLNTNKQDNS